MLWEIGVPSYEPMAQWRRGVDEGKDLDWWFVRASVHTGTE